MNGAAVHNLTEVAPTRFVPQPAPTFTVRGRGEALGAVGSPSGEFRRLHTHPHAELTEVRLHGAAHLTLTPAGEAVETLYLLSGSLRGELAGGTCVLGPGDTVVTENLAEPLVFTALTEVRLLYLAELPPLEGDPSRPEAPYRRRPARSAPRET